MKKWIIAGLCICLWGCSSATSITSSSAGEEEAVIEEEKHHCEIVVKDYGTMTLELDASQAPITVENFMELAESGFYDGLTFHRIMDGFMIQGGDPEGNGTGGSDKTIKGEFSANGVENNISHVQGVISMARAKPYDSASSQFFITVADSTFLDGNYAAFGYVTDGMDVALQIAKDANPVDDNGTILPEEQPVIIAGPFNAVVVHTSVPGLDRVAVGNFKDAVLSTLREDLPETVTPMAADDVFFMDESAPFGVGSGSAYFYNRNLYGSLILVRSMNGDFTFDNTDARTSDNVLVQSVLTFDPPSAVGYLTVGQGEDLPGISVTFLNGEYTGDILHQDYQRKMTVTVGDNSVLKGAIESGTWQGWNDLWAQEKLLEVLKADGYDEVPFANDSWAEEVQDNLILADDEAYAQTQNLGADVTVEAGGTWIVTATSTLSSLTIKDGAVLAAPEGMNLEVFIDADASNANSTYEGGTALEEIEPGTCENVILKVF